MTIHALGNAICGKRAGSMVARQLAYYKNGVRFLSDEDSANKHLYGDNSKRTGDSIPEQLELHAEGVLWWWDHPIWTALRRRMAFFENEKAILAVISHLPEEFRTLLISNYSSVRGPLTLYCTEATVRHLATLHPFNALAAAVLIAHQADVIRNPRLRRLAVSLYHRLGPRLRTLPQLKPFADELLIYVHLVCPSWRYDKANLAQRTTTLCPYRPRRADSERLTATFIRGEAPAGIASILPTCPALKNDWGTEAPEIFVHEGPGIVLPSAWLPRKTHPKPKTA